MSPKRAATKTLPSQPARKRKAPTNEDEVTELSVNLVEVDRDGDVLIIVGQGEDKLNIKVSGKVLGLASKVFHSMLSSGFMEASTGVIEMKDDDPEVVLDFCRVLHFDYSCLNDWDVRQMTLIADMADMRCCLEVFTPHILPRLSNLIKEIAKACLDPFITEKITAFLKKEGLTFELVLEIASKLDLNELFHQTVRLAIAQRPALVRLESMGADWNSVVTGDDDLDVYGLFSLSHHLVPRHLTHFKVKSSLENEAWSRTAYGRFLSISTPTSCRLRVRILRTQTACTLVLRPKWVSSLSPSACKVSQSWISMRTRGPWLTWKSQS